MNHIGVMRHDSLGSSFVDFCRGDVSGWRRGAGGGCRGRRRSGFFLVLVATAGE